MTYTEDDIRRITTEKAWRAGTLYQAQGRVIAFDNDGAGRITGKVQGNERRPYDQIIHIERHRSGQTVIDGECTCPVGENCKHVAAVLVEGLKRSAPRKPATALDRLNDRVARLVAAPAQSAPAQSAPTRRDGLPQEIAAWLDVLGRARDTADDTYPDSVNQRLVFVLVSVARTGKIPMLGVKPMSVRLLKTGQFADTGRYVQWDKATAGPDAKYMRPIDLQILGAMGRLKRDYATTELVLQRDTEGRLLAEMLGTGRARWQTVNGPALALGEPRTGRIEWCLTESAEMRPTLVADAGLVLLNATPPVYVDAEAGLIGPVETGLDSGIASTLLDAPPVAAAHVAEFSDAIVRRAPWLSAVTPKPPAPARVMREAPVPVLRLFKDRLPIAGAVPTYDYATRTLVFPQEDVGLGRLSFRYGPANLASTEDRAVLTRIHDGALIEIHRDEAAERRHVSTLAAHGFDFVAQLRPRAPAHLAHDFMPDGDGLAWLDAIYRELPQLEAEGWEIETAPDFPFQLLRGDGAVDAEIREGSGIDWFELGLGIVVDGQRIDLVGPIVTLLGTPGFDPAALKHDRSTDNEDEETFYLPLGGGRVLAVPVSRLVPIVAAIQELASGGMSGDGRLRLRAVDAASLAGFEDAARDAGIVWRGGERLLAMGRKLNATGGIPTVAPPRTFQATLRPYQSDGVSWLAFLRDVGFGGVLADDMGLGKTVQALALVAIEKAAGRLDGPALVVAPTSLMANWRREAERFAPDLRVLTLHGLDRKRRFAEIGASDLVLTTYPLVTRDHAELSARSWTILILDEAQTVKNPEAATTKLVLSLDARQRFCLSGTPLENHLGELWSLFSFAVPGLLGDRQSFTRHWRTPIEKQGNAARAALLARRIKPFMLRRTKDQVAPDLPPKTEIIERVEFQAAQRDIYESIRLSMHKRVRDAIASRGFARSRILILDALLKLRQACCDPRLLKLSSRAAGKSGSAKLERLEEMLEELRAEDRRILVFSQFTSMLDLIRPRLDAARMAYSLLTGETRDREAEIRRFQEGKTPVFLVSLKAGGTGLNLTAADTVILYDPWWNPAVEDQAIDRARRIGQDKPVFVHKLVASGTIEEKMEVLKQKKRELAESLFDHEGAPTLSMTEADLDMLFSPD